MILPPSFIVMLSRRLVDVMSWVGATRVPLGRTSCGSVGMRDFPFSDDVLPSQDNLLRLKGGLGCIRFDNDESIWITRPKVKTICRGRIEWCLSKAGPTTRRLENGVTAGSASHAGTLGAQRPCPVRIPDLTQVQAIGSVKERAHKRTQDHKQ